MQNEEQNKIPPWRLGEIRAKAKLEDLGFVMIDSGRHGTPYDLLVKRDGLIYAVNVKTGDTFTVTCLNLSRLCELSRRNGYVPAIYFQQGEDFLFFIASEMDGDWLFPPKSLAGRMTITLSDEAERLVREEAKIRYGDHKGGIGLVIEQCIRGALKEEKPVAKP